MFVSRFVIVKNVRRDLLQKLPLPTRLLEYLHSPHYYSEQVDQYMAEEEEEQEEAEQRETQTNDDDAEELEEEVHVQVDRMISPPASISTSNCQRAQHSSVECTTSTALENHIQSSSSLSCELQETNEEHSCGNPYQLPSTSFSAEDANVDSGCIGTLADQFSGQCNCKAYLPSNISLSSSGLLVSSFSETTGEQPTTVMEHANEEHCVNGAPQSKICDGNGITESIANKTVSCCEKVPLLTSVIDDVNPESVVLETHIPEVEEICSVTLKKCSDDLSLSANEKPGGSFGFTDKLEPTKMSSCIKKESCVLDARSSLVCLDVSSDSGDVRGLSNGNRDILCDFHKCSHLSMSLLQPSVVKENRRTMSARDNEVDPSQNCILVKATGSNRVTDRGVDCLDAQTGLTSAVVTSTTPLQSVILNASLEELGSF